MKLKTVKVKTDSELGYKIINESDMKEADKLYTEPKKKAVKKP